MVLNVFCTISHDKTRMMITNKVTIKKAVVIVV